MSSCEEMVRAGISHRNASRFGYLETTELVGIIPRLPDNARLIGACFAVDATRRSALADLEFETPPPAVRLRDFNPRDHQRLVVNPFLFAVAVVLLVKAVRSMLMIDGWTIVFWLFLPLPLLPQLIQFHCLDCGKTGRYWIHGRHACPNVVARWNQGRSARFAWASQQFLYWCWVLGSIGLLLAVLSLE